MKARTKPPCYPNIAQLTIWNGKFMIPAAVGASSLNIENKFQLSGSVRKRSPQNGKVLQPIVSSHASLHSESAIDQAGFLSKYGASF